MLARAARRPGHCPACGADGALRRTLAAPPPYLLVRVDLDAADAGGVFKRKVVLDMDADALRLGDLAERGDPVYRLIAFMDHSGAWAKLGHDIAYVRDGRGWIRFDDEAVTECQTLRSAVVFGRQYLYLFARVGADAGA
jgi:ubiquitin C-terminal hydrolase